MLVPLVYATHSLGRAAKGVGGGAYSKEILLVLQSNCIIINCYGEEGDLLLLCTICKAVSCVKDGQVIDILNVPLLKLCIDTKLLSNEV